MLTQVEAEVGIDGSVILLEPLRLEKRSRAIVTIFDIEPSKDRRQSKNEAEVAEKKFATHFGSVASGNPNSAENNKIDADLARAYSDASD